jgi:hypothetical protein
VGWQIREALPVAADIAKHDLPQTEADDFQFRNKIGLDVALEALHDSRRRKRATSEQRRAFVAEAVAAPTEALTSGEGFAAADVHRYIAAIEVIRDGIEILERHLLVGRPCEEELRELLISYGKNGYVALYSHEQPQDVAFGARHSAWLSGHGDVL